MRCQRCDQGDRRPVRRANLAERDGIVALVLDVPMQECPACGERSTYVPSTGVMSPAPAHLSAPLVVPSAAVVLSRRAARLVVAPITDSGAPGLMVDRGQVAGSASGSPSQLRPSGRRYERSDDLGVGDRACVLARIA